MSLKQDIFITIRDSIKGDAVLSKKVKTFRLFNNQFENERKENAFEYSAIFMQFENIDFIPTTGGSQQGDLLATFHIGIESLNDEDLSVFDLLDDFFKLLTDLNIGFTRVREEQDIDHDNIQVWKQSYKITLTDDTANINNRRRQKVTATTLEVDKQLIIDPNSVGGTRSDDKIE